LTDGALPPGLTLSADGVLEGTPTVAGIISFIITVTDARGESAGQSYYLDILSPIALSPPVLPNGMVGSAYRQVFNASGGTAPYTFALTDGALPPGLTLSASGVLEGTPGADGFYGFTVNATGADGISGSTAYNLFVSQALTITPFSLLDGVVGIAYSRMLIASGGTAPYSFALAAGELPPGLTLSPAGLLGGTSTAPGAFNFAVTVTDARGLTGSQAYSLFFTDVPLVISPGSLPDGRIGVGYRQRLTASGGTAPYRFALTDGALPPGLTLTRDGLLGGKPSAEGFFAFTINATDARGRSSGQFYGLSITQVSLSISPNLLPEGKVAVVYRQRLTASGGTAPYRFALAFGDLPSGLALSRDGWLRGRPTTAGNFNFAVTATDARGRTGSQFYSLNVAQLLTITPPFLLSSQAGTPYLQALAVSGGSAPYRFALSDGALPPGLTLSPAGVISGTPSREGFFGFTITATDARGRSSSQFYFLTTLTPIGLGPQALLTGKVGSTYRQVLSASGGVAPYTFAVTDGSLPPGLTLGADGVLDGTPTVDGGSGFTITATDARGISGSRFYSMFIAQALAISPIFLPQTTIDSDYAVTLTASGGTAPYSFAITFGDLPPGLTLSADGLLSGTPTTQGFFSFGVTATDAAGLTGIQYYNLAITAPLIAISPPSLPDGNIGGAYQQQLSASGGTGPYVFVATDLLPPGLLLTPAGLLHGTPTAGGSFDFVVTAFDARGFAGGQLYNLSIAPFTISPATLPGAIVGTPYSQQLTANGGVEPYIFLDVSMFSPPGLTLSRDGLLSGTPTGEGFFGIDMLVVDSRGFRTRQSYFLEIIQPLTISTPALPDGMVGASYNATIGAFGGSFPYNFTLTDGAVPPGLELANSGELSGTPTIAGVYSFTVTVTDGGGRTAFQEYTVIIN
jgi:hypothetical protein